MPRCLFERATGLFAGGTMHDDMAHDTATHVQLTLASYPDRRVHRWDGAAGVRAATSQELADYDAAEADEAAAAGIDGMKALKALVIWLAPLVGKTPAEARDEIIAIHKSL